MSHSECRIRRLIHNQNQRADVSLEKRTAKITSQGAKRLARASEVNVILDGSDLRKLHRSSLEFSSTERDLEIGFRAEDMLVVVLDNCYGSKRYLRDLGALLGQRR